MEGNEITIGKKEPRESKHLLPLDKYSVKKASKFA